MAFETTIVKLEDKMQELSPATTFFSFMRDCMIDNQDALFYGLSRYVVLFDPDATDCASAIKVGCMENIGEGFNMENKSLMEIFFEHGLANYWLYSGPLFIHLFFCFGRLYNYIFLYSQLKAIHNDLHFMYKIVQRV